LPERIDFSVGYQTAAIPVGGWSHAESRASVGSGTLGRPGAVEHRTRPEGVQSLAARGQGARAEGGEALAFAGVIASNNAFAARGMALAPTTRVEPTGAPWHVLWTHSNCEDLVGGQLAAAGFHPFAPRIESWVRRNGERRAVKVPLFPGYLFINDTLDKARHVEVRKARGVVAVLGEGWERPAVVAPEDMDAIRKLVDARMPALLHPYLSEGRRVRIVAGPLEGVEGILARVRLDKGLLVLSVDLLQRSVAVEVDCTQVEPA
jgi:transcription termination/antitermination protein NusG